MEQAAAEKDEAQALKALGRELAEEAEVLVFDEMQITDVRSPRLDV